MHVCAYVYTCIIIYRYTYIYIYVHIYIYIHIYIYYIYIHTHIITFGLSLMAFGGRQWHQTSHIDLGIAFGFKRGASGTQITQTLCGKSALRVQMKPNSGARRAAPDCFASSPRNVRLVCG